MKRIGVMMQLEQPFKRHVSIYAGVLDYEKKHPNFKVVVDEWADRALPSNRGGLAPYDGVLGRIGKSGAERCSRLGVPAVSVWLSSPAKNLPGVFPDYVASGRLVAEHLLSRGFRNLAALLQTGDKGTSAQADGMRAFVEIEGVGEWRGTLTIDSPEIYEQWRRGREALDRWMDTWTLPLGLLVLDPSWARVIIERAHDRGWRVPDQIAIVCSNNDGLQCERPDPGLTAVELPYEQVGYEAAKMLDALIDSKRHGEPPPTEPQILLLPAAGIVARHSTDFFAVDDALVGSALRHIAAHLDKPLSVPAVGKAVGVPRRTLDAWFAKALGATVATEIMRLRIERVKRELIAGKDAVETIALRTGFASIRTLNDQFKRSTGMAPTAFRERGTAVPSSGTMPGMGIFSNDMPRRELSHPHQIVDWLVAWGDQISEPASMTLIGSAALLWHAAIRGLDTPLPENSMDVDPVTDSDTLAWMCYDAIIGSEFEREHGWHVNLLPASVLQEFPFDWQGRATSRDYGRLTVVVPCPADLLVPKLKRNEPRDRAHSHWARDIGLL